MIFFWGLSGKRKGFASGRGNRSPEINRWPHSTDGHRSWPFVRFCCVFHGPYLADSQANAMVLGRFFFLKRSADGCQKLFFNTAVSGGGA